MAAKNNFYIKNYESLYKKSIRNIGLFWCNIAGELYWFKPWQKVLSWKFPYASWFVGGKTNIVFNALDRHLETSTADKIAFIWEGQDGLVRKYTYRKLNDEVCRLANVLKNFGVKKGDRVAIYLLRLPEQVISMLACAKIGAIHTVIYSGFSTEALKTRILAAKPKVVITTDGYYYREKIIKTKEIVDEAVKNINSVRSVIVVKRIGIKISLRSGRDFWWHKLVSKSSPKCKTLMVSSGHPLFILYTSGTTGKPKGILHAHGGYMVGIYITLKWIFNIEKDDIYWCTADAGWVTGHSYVVYSPLINGVTSFIYEGPPDYPDAGKYWSLIEKYKITKFYTTPTTIRSLMRYGEEIPQKYNLSSLKILGSVGEPLNPEAWRWFHKHIGKGKCPIMDTWWQTETGMHMISPLPSVKLKPGSVFKPFFGVEADIVDEDGHSVKPGKQGFLIIKKPWPAMFKNVYQDSQKYQENYWQKIPNVYFTGDAAKKDKDGYFWIQGRCDDVLKISGYLLGTAELESIFVFHPSVSEAAVIGKPHEIKGNAIKAFVILKKGIKKTDLLKEELKNLVRKMIGPIATPDEIEFVDSLPKTRSGKIMRRLLKARELGLPIGDISTLEE
jgi:acetyl-CoA synthetase